MHPAPPPARVLHLDMETRSTCDLRKAGVYKYSEHPTTGLWLFSYRFDRGPTRRWREGEPLPQDVVDHIAGGGTVAGHNVAFERVMWNQVVRWYPPGAPKISIDQCECTMVRAHAVALPPPLGTLAEALRLDVQKDKEGASLMMRMCRPRSIGEDGEIIWWDVPERVERLAAYCDTDVDTECAADAVIPRLSAAERELWHMTEEMNDRGVRIDLEMVDKAMAVVEVAKKRLDLRMARLTGGAVKKTSNAKALVGWLTGRGIECESVAKGEQDELEIRIKGAADDAALEALQIRQQGSKASTSKLKAMQACACADGRARGQIQHHGANTGRAAGRLIQPQNLFRIDPERDLPTVRAVYSALEHFDCPIEAHDVIELIVGDVMLSMAKSLRGMFIAADGHELIVGDLSNIEGRFNAWVAGEDWKVQAFRDYDAGTGADLYNIAYAKSFGVDIESVGKAQRQIGKVQELALGYQGSVGAFINMAANYGLKPQQLAEAVRRAVGDNLWNGTAYGFKDAVRQGRGYDLTEFQWTGLKIVVDGYREANPAIVQGWWDAQDAAIEAVDAPGRVVPCYHGRVRYMASNGFLWCCLPSGRLIAYANARLVETRDDAGRLKRSVHFERYFQKRWITSSLYGGLQCNNIVQGGARDIFKLGQKRVRAAGYPIVLEVHDELVAEVPVGAGSTDEFASLMAVNPPWAQGLPLAVKAGRDRRYVK